MNYRDFSLGDWIGHISGAIEDERELDGNEMRDLLDFLTKLPRIPDNATNGDVIKALFKDRDLSSIQERLEHTHWWDAPYKREGDGE